MARLRLFAAPAPFIVGDISTLDLIAVIDRMEPGVDLVEQLAPVARVVITSATEIVVHGLEPAVQP